MSTASAKLLALQREGRIIIDFGITLLVCDCFIFSAKKLKSQLLAIILTTMVFCVATL